MVYANGRRARVSALVAVIAMWSARAEAQSAEKPKAAPPHATLRPWAKGVPEQEQALALGLYLAGNQEFTESRFAQALAKYKEAVRHWDNPAIRFNMAISLINLDEPVEAKDNLERSLVYGEAALGADLYNQGLTYRKLLDAQLVHLTLASADAGARVTLDGKLVFIGPGTSDQVVLPGEHQAVATRNGTSVSEVFLLVAGKARKYELRPITEPKLAASVPCVAERVPSYTPPYAYTPPTNAVAAKAPAAQAPPPQLAISVTQPSPTTSSALTSASVRSSVYPVDRAVLIPSAAPPASSTTSVSSTTSASTTTSVSTTKSWADLVAEAQAPTPSPYALRTTYLVPPVTTYFTLAQPVYVPSPPRGSPATLWSASRPQAPTAAAGYPPPGPGESQPPLPPGYHPLSLQGPQLPATMVVPPAPPDQPPPPYLAPPSYSPPSYSPPSYSPPQYQPPTWYLPTWNQQPTRNQQKPGDPSPTTPRQPGAPTPTYPGLPGPGAPTPGYPGPPTPGFPAPTTPAPQPTGRAWPLAQPTALRQAPPTAIRPPTPAAVRPPASTYHAPASTYRAPTPTYHAPTPTYHAPTPTYHAPTPTYHAPTPTYQAPTPTYHAPTPTYHAPTPTFHR